MPFARRLEIEDVPTDKPILLFDIDGVFNAFMNGHRESYWCPAPELPEDEPRFTLDCRGEASLFDQRTAQREGTFTIQWSSELANIVRAFHEKNDVNYIWLTSWDDNADNFANDTIWPDQPSPMLGYIWTGTRRRTSDSKISQVSRLRSHLIDLLLAEKIDTIPPIVHFDDDWVADFRGDNEFYAPRWDIQSKLKMGVSPYLFINTNPRYGITPNQWDEATQFIQTHQTRKLDAC